jgi:putative glutamine amidotransferase
LLPLIAIPGRQGEQAAGFRTTIVGAGERYLDAVTRAGAAPLVVGPGLGHEALPALLERVDGLLLLGGGDVDPSRYGATLRHPAVYDVRPEQDAFELAALLCAVDRGLPVLAICRGAQLLDVAYGGTLHQHLGDEAAAGHRGTVHGVDVVEGSRVAELVGGLRAEVASSHHQAIDAVGPGLSVTARADDGTIEAVELDDDERWVVGVQWHPEDTAATDPAQQSVFDGFVARCRQGRSRA